MAWKPDADGAVAVWSADNRPLRLKLVVKHTLTGEEVATYNISDDAGADPLVLVTPDFSGETDLAVTASDALGKAYTDSYVLALARRAPSGKHGYYIQFHIDIPKTNEGARYNLGLVVEGAPGEHADMWIESEYGTLHGLFVKGWSNGADDCPLSSMACAPGVVCVGASASRLEWPKVDGTTETIWQYDTYTLGDVAPFSSYGVLSDGRTLPHVVAPGAALISVLSTPFVEANGAIAACAIGHSDGRTDYWFADFGTSMSAPTVAGALALWLEADPSLSSDDILEIIDCTSRRDAVTDAAPVKWGAGPFRCPCRYPRSAPPPLGPRRAVGRRALHAGRCRRIGHHCRASRSRRYRRTPHHTLGCGRGPGLLRLRHRHTSSSSPGHLHRHLRPTYRQAPPPLTFVI